MTEQAVMVPIDEIHADEEFNCRGAIAPIDIKDLAEDIGKNGLLQPVVLCEYDAEHQAKFGKKFKLLAGFRRFSAHQLNKAEEIWATVRNVSDESSQRILNLRENIQRKDLTVLQEAKALKPLFDKGLTEGDIMAELGVKRGWTQIRKMLLALPTEIQLEVEEGFITQTQVRHLYTTLKDRGEEATFEHAREMKDAKIQGKKRVNTNPKSKPDRPRVRKRPEIFELQDHIYNMCRGNNIVTRTLAWCAGEISDIEYEAEVEKFCTEHGFSYVARELS